MSGQHATPEESTSIERTGFGIGWMAVLGLVLIGGAAIVAGTAAADDVAVAGPADTRAEQFPVGPTQNVSMIFNVVTDDPENTTVTMTSGLPYAELKPLGAGEYAVDSYIPVDPETGLTRTKVVVERHVEDGPNHKDSHTSLVRVTEEALVDPALPQERSTGIETLMPITGERFDLEVEVDADFGTLVDENDPEFVFARWWEDPAKRERVKLDDDPIEKEDSFVFQASALHSGPEDLYYAYTPPGEPIAITHDVKIVENSPAEVEAYPNQTYQGSGIADLRAHVQDPEHRTHDQMEFGWFLVDSPILDKAGLNFLKVDDQQRGRFQLSVENVNERLAEEGLDIELESVAGVHEFRVVVEDPYGAISRDNLTVIIDDQISVSAALTNADAEPEDGVYIYDPTQRDGLQERVRGTVEVLNETGAPVDGALIQGEVWYQSLFPTEIRVNTFEVTTDASGTADFAYSKALTGAAGGEESITDLPGRHEIRIDASAENSQVEPTEDTNRAETALTYFVQPEAIA